MEKKRDKFEALSEASGQRSMTRVVFLLGSIWSMAFTTALAFSSDIDPAILIAVFGSLQGTYIGLKLGQKPMEGKKPNGLPQNELK